MLASLSDDLIIAMIKGEHNMKISVTKATELLENAPYIKDGMDHYQNFCKLRDILKNPDVSEYPQLCDGRVIAVWYLSGLVYPDYNNPQLLVRVSEHKDSIDNLHFCSQIHKFTHDDVIYDYDKDIIEGDHMIMGLQEELINEIADGRVYIIYNRNRKEDK